MGYRNDDDALARFGRKVQARRKTGRSSEVSVVEGRDEPMVHLLRRRQLSPRQVAPCAHWSNGETQMLSSLPERRIADPAWTSLLADARLRPDFKARREHDYLLFLRPESNLALSTLAEGLARQLLLTIKRQCP